MEKKKKKRNKMPFLYTEGSLREDLKKQKMQGSVWEPVFCIPLLFTQRRDVKYSPNHTIRSKQLQKEEQSQPGTVTLSPH